LAAPGGKISIYTRNTSSGTYSDFKELCDEEARLRGGSQKMAGNDSNRAEFGKNSHGVGYVWHAYTKAGGIKVVSIDGVFPRQNRGRTTTYFLLAADVLLHKW